MIREETEIVIKCKFNHDVKGNYNENDNSDINNTDDHNQINHREYPEVLTNTMKIKLKY